MAGIELAATDFAGLLNETIQHASRNQCTRRNAQQLDALHVPIAGNCHDFDMWSSCCAFRRVHLIRLACWIVSSADRRNPLRPARFRPLSKTGRTESASTSPSLPFASLGISGRPEILRFER
ncbi:hypothetical protein I545_6837 [Mycobacterium kansasii 662]|uniref:Uncharacterized protein n=1 Tax=Mycobacterium kansasii 662 TaxID=1299326 RepID=X7XQT2_MYCKA|nr:hypothetical protein I545_6837 [Mycobacterium kansasii 662]